MRTALMTLLSFVVGTSVLRAQDLPAGAIARLGSDRFRVNGFTRALAYGPDERSLVAYVASGAVVTWERDTGKERRRFDVTRYVPSVFSSDGKTFAQSVEKHIRLWDISTGKELPKLTAPKRDYEFTPAFSHDGSKLAVAGEDRVVVFDWADGKTLLTLKTQKPPLAVAFSPDAKWLAVRLYDPSVVQLWDAASGKHVRDIKSNLVSSFRAGMCFAPDSALIAWNEFGRVQVASVATGEHLATVESTFEASGFIFSADSKSLIYGVQGTGVHVWDIALKKKTHDLSKDTHRHALLVLAPDGKTLAIGDRESDHRQLRFFDLAARTESPVDPGHHIDLNLVAFAADSATLATSDRTRVIFWDARTGQRQREVKVKHNYSPILSPDLRHSIRRWIDTLQVLELAEGKETTEFKHGIKDYLQWTALTRDGKQMVSVHARRHRGHEGHETIGQNTLQVWDWTKHKPLRSFPTVQDAFYAGLLLSPDDALAIMPTAHGRVDENGQGVMTDYSKGGPIHVWNLGTGSLGPTLTGHKGSAPYLAVSGDARLLASGGVDHSARLWELASGKPIFNFALGDASAQPVALSPDGRLLAAPCEPKGGRPYIGVWDVATGWEAHRFPAADAGVHSLAFSPDGTRLASGMYDATVFLWDTASIRAGLKRPAMKLTPEDAAARSRDLRDLDAHAAHRAAWALIDAGDAALAHLDEHVRSARVDPKVARRLAADLDSASFATRDKAASAIVSLGDLAEPALLDFLATNPSLEARRRVEPLLNYESMFANPATLARLRSIHVLEQIGTPDARHTLTTLADGIPNARTTREAAAALLRLRR